LRQPAAIGEKDKKYRCFADPRHFGKEIGNSMNFHLVPNNKDIGLLKIALRRG
jgi:hypothetical protein